MKGFMQFFDCSHLRPDLQEVARPFRIMAAHLIETLPRNPEATVAMRKLMEAKDCAIRAHVFRTD